MTETIAATASGGELPLWINPLTILLATIAVVTVIVQVARWAERVNHTRSDFNDHKKSLADFMAEIREDIKRIFDRLPSPVVAGQSPLKLTDFGQRISASLKASEWAGALAPNLQERVVGMAAYEIQEFCREYVRGEFNPTREQDVELKMCAYENGVSTATVLEVLAIELRDALLPADNQSNCKKSLT